MNWNRKWIRHSLRNWTLKLFSDPLRFLKSFLRKCIIFVKLWWILHSVLFRWLWPLDLTNERRVGADEKMERLMEISLSLSKKIRRSFLSNWMDKLLRSHNPDWFLWTENWWLTPLTLVSAIFLMLRANFEFIIWVKPTSIFQCPVPQHISATTPLRGKDHPPNSVSTLAASVPGCFYSFTLCYGAHRITICVTEIQMSFHFIG